MIHQSIRSNLALPTKIFHRLSLSLIAVSLLSESIRADDWPQILGPNRDGVVKGVKLSPGDWPNELQPDWSLNIGSGYGGAAIVDSTAFIMHRQQDREKLWAIDLESGARHWEASWPASYRASYNPDDGPRCTPTIQDDLVICYGAAGDLVAVQKRNGVVAWSRALRKEYDADDGYFGAGSSPLVHDEKIVVCLGGERAGVIALDLKTGKTIWQATDYDASYASPITVDLADRKALLVVTRLNTLLMDLDTGKVLSDVRFGSRGPTVNAATPIRLAPKQLLLTASYGIGSTVLELDGTQLNEVVKGSRLLSSQYNTPVLVNGRVIGVDGREDIGVASLVAIDFAKEEELWREEDFGTAHLLAVGTDILALTKPGKLRLVDGQSSVYRELVSRDLPPGDYRAIPAMSGKRLVVRAGRGSQGTLACYRLP